MVSIEVDIQVKKKLKKFKEKEGCKTFSDTINILLLKNKFFEKYEN